MAQITLLEPGHWSIIADDGKSYDLVLYQATTTRWYARIRRESDLTTIELKFVAKPTPAIILAAADPIFNPPTVQITNEDGTTINLAHAQALILNLTPAQRTALNTAKTTIETLMARLVGFLPTDPDVIVALRNRNPFLDWLLSIHDRLGV